MMPASSSGGSSSSDPAAARTMVTLLPAFAVSASWVPRLAAQYTFGTKSANSPYKASSFSVADPIAAIFTSAGHRNSFLKSILSSAICSKKTLTPMGLVKTSHSSSAKCPNAFISRSSTGFGEIVFVSIAGSSMTWAPRERSLSESLEPFCLGRVTRICLPPRGRSSAQWKVSASAQTSPTTMIAGVPIAAFSASSARCSTVETTRLCAASVPFSRTAAGV